MVWAFSGNRNHFPSAVFTEPSKVEEWIKQHGLEGTLTAYPLDIGVYEWAVRRGIFKSTRAEHSSGEFIANCSSAAQEQYQYEKDTAQ